jgi:hypothetical protein
VTHQGPSRKALQQLLLCQDQNRRGAARVYSVNPSGDYSAKGYSVLEGTDYLMGQVHSRVSSQVGTPENNFTCHISTDIHTWHA